ncbi:MAG: hypothetical protein HY786_06590 [Deltaproteobacteria bacterium]|nr:hypothetical protein [Deltaproteobacteria bacterium]
MQITSVITKKDVRVAGCIREFGVRSSEFGVKPLLNLNLIPQSAFRNPQSKG